MKRYFEIIKELREDNDLSQKQVADYLGIKQQVYSIYELGNRALPIKYLIRLCEFYDVSADYILCTSNMDAFSRTYARLSNADKEKVNAYMQGLLDK